jgi:hypothetical protein
LSLWAEQSPRGNLLREFSRQLNNSLALASQNVREVRLPGQSWMPTVVIQGRLYHRIGPLQPAPNQTPSFAQIYVHDPEHNADDEARVRLGHMHLPQGTSQTKRGRLEELLIQLQAWLRLCNGYVQDFISACELGEGEVENQRLVINAEARPAGAHERIYNRPEGWHEVAVLMDEQPGPRDVTLHRRGGGLANISETHRAFDALHYVLLFPLGEDGWNLGLRHVSGQNNKVSVREFYAYTLHQREGDRDSLFRASRLFQEFCCMAFAKVESMRLQYLAMTCEQNCTKTCRTQ